jgi:putative restriction endonuclease
MAGYAVITENDTSEWNDRTGHSYHFPLRYLKYLSPGTKVIYYKGRMKSPEFKKSRLVSAPHYFGVAEIGSAEKDNRSTKNDYYAKIIHYTPFTSPILAKVGARYLEDIPASRESNYWRDGVREISFKTYQKILAKTGISDSAPVNDLFQGSDESLTSFEGESKSIMTTVYERNPALRQKAIDHHGYTCMACDFSFEETYGKWGIGFVHVHHIKPLSTTGIVAINPKEDLIVLCANCHAMVHRRKNTTLSLAELIAIIRKK